MVLTPLLVGRVWSKEGLGLGSLSPHGPRESAGRGGTAEYWDGVVRGGRESVLGGFPRDPAVLPHEGCS